MKKPKDTSLTLSADYRQFVAGLKSRVASAHLSASRHVNRELISLYWDIGRGIVERQQALSWGESVGDMVAAGLRTAFPDMSGFSPRNVRDMRRFYLAYSDPAIWPQLVAKLSDSAPGQFPPQLVAEIPWGHHRFLLDKVSNPAARLWYLRATASFGWSRNVLLNQIKAGAYERAVTEKKTHNFNLALPEDFAGHADEMLKSSYNLEFLGLRRAVRERELKDRLITQPQ